MSECTGHCCEKFWLPHSYKKLINMWREKEIVNNCRMELTRILEMIIPLGKIYDFTMFGIDKGYFYTCRYFNKNTRKCDNYLLRPHICRDYPFSRRNGVCCYIECTHSKRMKFFTDKI